MPEIVQLAEKKPDDAAKATEAGASSASSPPRTSWSGSLRIGLVNIPVKAMLMTRDLRISFRMLHRSCKTAISFKRFCQEGEEVQLADIVFGYPMGDNRYAVLEKKEIENARPESRNTIALEGLVRSKVDNAVAVPEKKKGKTPAKSLMEALRLTAQSLK